MKKLKQTQCIVICETLINESQQSYHGLTYLVSLLRPPNAAHDNDLHSSKTRETSSSYKMQLETQLQPMSQEYHEN